MASGLEHNTSLQVLYMDDNEMGDFGGVAFARLLSKNASLTHLSLKSCDFSSRCAAELTTSLRENRALKKLSLNYNDFSHAESGRIIEAGKRAEMLEVLIIEFQNEVGTGLEYGEYWKLEPRWVEFKGFTPNHPWLWEELKPTPNHVVNAIS